jgi:hypothetical protein
LAVCLGRTSLIEYQRHPKFKKIFITLFILIFLLNKEHNFFKGLLKLDGNQLTMKSQEGVMTKASLTERPISRSDT